MPPDCNIRSTTHYEYPSFQDVAKSVRSEAETRGLRATMSRINDAIALACYGKKYAAVVAAEKAGNLGAIPTPPPHIKMAARRYQMDEHAFGLSLHDGIEGRLQAGNDGTVDMAMDWLLAKHKPELLRLEEQELTTLADRALVGRVLAQPQFASTAALGFAEWVIAEGEVRVDGRPQKVAELLLHGAGRPAWHARQRAYIAALAAAPLQLYHIEAVTAGYHLILRPVGENASRLLQVAERSGSQPDLVGSMIAARVITRHERLELAGGLFTFRPVADLRVAEAVRLANGAAEVSRVIRSAWFAQFDQPLPRVVLAGTGEPMRLITDTYRCSNFGTLAARLADDSRVEGNMDLGWSLVVKQDDGRERSMCTIAPAEDRPDYVTVFYESELRAKTYRSWFEGQVGDAVTFVERESVDPYEAANDPSLAGMPRNKPQISADDMKSVMAHAYQQIYADFADKPVPALDGATPGSVSV